MSTDSPNTSALPKEEAAEHVKEEAQNGGAMTQETQNGGAILDSPEDKSEDGKASEGEAGGTKRGEHDAR